MLEISNEHLQISLDPATAVCRSLKYDGEDLIHEPRLLFAIKCTNSKEIDRAAFILKISDRADTYQISFKGCSLIVTLRIKARHNWIIWEVLATSEEIEKFYISKPISNYNRENLFIQALPITLPVECDGDKNTIFSKSVGIAGQAALIIGHRSRMPDVLKMFQKTAFSFSSPVGGAFAADYPPNHENYLFVQHPTLQNADEWIKLCHDIGIGKVFLDEAFRHGDFQPFKEYYPNGIDDLRKVVARFQNEGIRVALETRSHFIGVDSPLAKRTDELVRLENGQLWQWTDSYISKPDTQLYLDVADNLATFYKTLEANGGIYFDALDVVGRFRDANYFAGLFVQRVMTAIPSYCPAGMAVGYNSFYPYRSHYAPYDYPKADFDGFVAKHALDIQTDGLTMVLDMGWIALNAPESPSPAQMENYLAICHKIGAIYGVVDLSPESIKKPEVRLLAEMLKSYNKTIKEDNLPVDEQRILRKRPGRFSNRRRSR